MDIKNSDSHHPNQIVRANPINKNRNHTRGFSRFKQKFNRALLPTPASYYSKQFQNFKIKSEWVKVICCFHEDQTPSLNISMIDGHFRCFSCGAKGCDVLAFHRLRYKICFTQAVDFFGAWEDTYA